MTTRAYSQRHLISVAELASAIAIARGTTGVDELRELARQAEDGNLAALPLYPPHQLWQHGGDVNRIGAPTKNPAAIWRMLAAKVRKPHLSDKDAFNYPPAASTWHMLAADVYGLGKNHALNRRAAAALRELAIRYSPELGDDETEPASAAPPEAVLMPPQTQQSPQETPAYELTQTTPSAPVAPVTDPAGHEAKSASARRRYYRMGWKQTAAFEHVVNVFASIAPATAKQLCAELKKSALGDTALGVKHGALFVRETGKALNDKTIENSLPTIRIQAQKLPRESHFPAKHSRE